MVSVSLLWVYQVSKGKTRCDVQRLYDMITNVIQPPDLMSFRIFVTEDLT